MGIRVEIDNSGNRLAKQIRTAEQEKIPLVAVVGEKERDSNTLSVRARTGGDLGAVGTDFILDSIKTAIDNSVELIEVDGIDCQLSPATE